MGTDDLPENDRHHLSKASLQSEINNNNKLPISLTLIMPPVRIHLTGGYEILALVIVARDSSQDSDTVPRIAAFTTAKVIRAHQSFEQYIYNQH